MWPSALVHLALSVHTVTETYWQWSSSGGSSITVLNVGVTWPNSPTAPASRFEAARAMMLLCVHTLSTTKHSYQLGKWNHGQTLVRVCVCTCYAVNWKPVCTHQCRSLHLNPKTIHAPLERLRPRPHRAQVRTSRCYTWRSKWSRTLASVWHLVLHFHLVRNKTGQKFLLGAVVIRLQKRWHLFLYIVQFWKDTAEVRSCSDCMIKLYASVICYKTLKKTGTFVGQKCGYWLKWSQAIFKNPSKLNISTC